MTPTGRTVGTQRARQRSNWSVAEIAPDGAPADFDAVHAGQRNRLLRVAFLATGSRVVAEDIVQEAFLRLHQHLGAVENPHGFLRTVVVRLCSHWRDRQASESRALQRIEEPPPLGEPELDTTWDLLARLQPERRVALVLRFYEDLAYDEIASLVDCSVVTARTRVHRGLRDLRKEMSK